MEIHYKATLTRFNIDFINLDNSDNIYAQNTKKNNDNYVDRDMTFDIPQTDSTSIYRMIGRISDFRNQNFKVAGSIRMV